MREDSRPLAGSGWTVGELAAAAFFVGYLAVQVGIPLLQLPRPGPQRFGWQMFSRVGHERPDIALSLEGRSRPIELERYVVQLRSEIDLGRKLPPHLCRAHPAADTVVVRRPSGAVSALPCDAVRE